MMQVDWREAKRIARQYTDERNLLADKQPLSVIHRTFKDGHKTSEVQPTWLANVTMSGLAAGNEPLVASARIVDVS